VLVVENEEPCIELLEVALQGIEGVDVLVANNGREALRILESAKGGVSAMITDLEMPIMDGFALLESVKGRFPVVVISADVDPETPARVRSLGASAFFSKPYSPAQLRQTIQRLLEVRGDDPI
jgi:CheY-like chemotaxis protein